MTILLIMITFCSAQQVEQISKNVYRICALEIDKKKREIIAPGEINMQKGAIELLACGPYGKLHESVIKLDVVPSHLQTALLLIGAEPSGDTITSMERYKPKGDRVLVFVEWKDRLGRTTRVRAEDLVYNVKDKRPMEKCEWIFNGSRFIDGKFIGDIEQSIVTTYNDPFSIIDNPLDTGADDTYYEVNSAITPTVGTKIKMVIKLVD